MKIIFNIFRGLIITYLIVLAFLFVILYVKKNSYHEDYLDVNGYSYYKIDNATLEPDIRKGRDRSRGWCNFFRGWWEKSCA